MFFKIILSLPQRCYPGFHLAWKEHRQFINTTSDFKVVIISIEFMYKEEVIAIDKTGRKHWHENPRY